MASSRLRRYRAPFAAALMMLIVPAGAARAQGRTDCGLLTASGFGVSAGRSSPYFYLAGELAEEGRPGSVSVRGGSQISGRAEMPIGGPWRTRIEGSRAKWAVERRTYGDGFQVVATDTIGHVEARQLVGMVGRQGGRSPVCGYVLAGGGLYSLRYRSATLTRPGFALATGIEMAAGDHGAVQVEVQLHVIDTGSRPPVTGSAALAASLSVGWAYRF